MVVATSAVADEKVHFGPYDLPRLFAISKSENKNEVVYGIRLDERCAPRGEAPVFGYWGMNERGPGETDPLLDRELRAYGIASQRAVAGGAEGGTVDMVLRAVPSRHILVTTRRVGSECKAWSLTSIGGTDAYLYSIYLKLKWFWRVDYILISGWTTDGVRVVHERIDH